MFALSNFIDLDSQQSVGAEELNYAQRFVSSMLQRVCLEKLQSVQLKQINRRVHRMNTFQLHRGDFCRRYTQF